MWISPESLETLPIHHTTRLRLQHFLEYRASLIPRVTLVALTREAFVVASTAHG
jgi:hypothetical protein